MGDGLGASATLCVLTASRREVFKVDRRAGDANKSFSFMKNEVANVFGERIN